MTEGLHAEITADTSNFVSAVDSARRRAHVFKSALAQVRKGAVDFTPAVNNTFRPLTRMARGTATATKNFKVMKGATQQLGFQIQDIAVQLQAGQNALMVFGQQGSQIAGIFGPGGAVVGAVLAVTAAIGTGLIAALTGAGVETNKLTQEVNSLNAALERTKLFDLTDDATLSAEKVQRLSEELRGAQASLDTLKFGPQFAEFATVTAAAEEKVKDLTRALAFEKATLDGINAAIKNLGQGDGFILSDSGTEKAAKEQKKADEEAVKAEQRRAQLIHLQKAQAFIKDFEQQQAWAEVLETAEDEAFNRRTQNLREFLSGQHGMIDHNLGAIVELTRRSQGMQSAVMLASFGTILSSTATFSKKAFKLNQAFAIGDAIVSAYQGIAKTMAQYPFPVSAAMAAAQGAMAFAQVRAIKAQTFGGAGGGGGGAAAALPGAVGTTQTGAQAPAENQVVTINLEGEVFGKEQVRGLLGQINEALDDGATLRIG